MSSTFHKVKKAGSKGCYVVSEHLVCLADLSKICYIHSYVSHVYANVAEPDLNL